jgi:hypothetical protein
MLVVPAARWLSAVVVMVGMAVAMTVIVDVSLPLDLTDTVLSNPTNTLGKLSQAEHIVL